MGVDRRFQSGSHICGNGGKCSPAGQILGFNIFVDISWPNIRFRSGQIFLYGYWGQILIYILSKILTFADYCR